MRNKKALSANAQPFPDGILEKYRKIPTVVTVTGDFARGLNVRGYALKLLQQLSNFCGYRSIQAGAAAERRYEFPDGVTIELRIQYGRSYVHIFVPKPGLEQPEEPLSFYPEAFRCVMFAIVDAIHPSLADGLTEEELQQQLIYRTRFDYDVTFFYQDSYVSLLNYDVFSAGAQEHKVGQYVLLGPSADYEYEPRCCVDDRELAEAVYDTEPIKLNTGFLDVYPIHNINGMNKVII